MNEMSIVGLAANIREGSSTELTHDDFFAIYPQFMTAELPLAVVDMYVESANAAIQEERWHSRWRQAFCLYVAHYCTMWMKTATSADAPASSIVHAGDAKGAMTSKSVGGVSVSYGQTSADSDLMGFGSLRDTIYGQQLASLAKLTGIGMMVVR